jgi:CheY-like chemotaxis protein
MLTAERTKSADILLVEDHPDAVVMAREALAGCALVRELHVACDGVEALSFLRREGPHAGAPRPALILLDLNLPKKNGFEVLEAIKQDAALKAIPVIVLSTSGVERDILACYKLHANAYVVKPLDFDEFCRFTNNIVHFWLETAALPANKEG